MSCRDDKKTPIGRRGRRRLVLNGAKACLTLQTASLILPIPAPRRKTSKASALTPIPPVAGRRFLLSPGEEPALTVVRRLLHSIRQSVRSSATTRWIG